MKKKYCNSIGLTQAPYTMFGIGFKRGNPKRCLLCGQPIKHGETWTKDVSAADPKHGRYSTIQHSPHCPDPKARNAYQKRPVGEKRKS
jgi:hypothetical protein